MGQQFSKAVDFVKRKKPSKNKSNTGGRASRFIEHFDYNDNDNPVFNPVLPGESTDPAPRTGDQPPAQGQPSVQAQPSDPSAREDNPMVPAQMSPEQEVVFLMQFVDKT